MSLGIFAAATWGPLTGNGGRTGSSRIRAVAEFEAEAVSFLVCNRKDIDNHSDRYLSGYLDHHDEIPLVSPETFMKAAGLIEQMETTWMKPMEE